jgi:hypothetical protein
MTPEAGGWKPGPASAPIPAPASGIGLPALADLCDYCGEDALVWRKCKLICERCGNIVKSCADL